MKRFLIILMIITISAALFTSCGSKGSEEKNDEPEITAPSVAEKCYVFAGMSSEDEEFDEELLKEMFSIDDLSEYLVLYFDKDGKVLANSKVFSKAAEEGKWKQDNTELDVEVDLSEYDEIEFQVAADGLLTGTLEQEDADFTITMTETQDIPEEIKSSIG